MCKTHPNIRPSGKNVGRACVSYLSYLHIFKHSLPTTKIMGSYKANPKSKYIAIRVAEQHHEKLKDLSDKEGLSVSDLLRVELMPFFNSL